MPAPTKPQLAIYAVLAVAVLLIGMRFLRAQDGASGGGGGVAAPLAAAGGASGGGGGGSGAGAAGGLGDGTSAGLDDGMPDGVGAAAPDEQLVVDVKGAVRRPGVYRLPEGSRALDAVRRAGGVTRRADRVAVNLAARVVDGGEVVVPARVGRGSAAGAGASPAAGATGAGGTGAGAAATGAPLAIDLNTATAEELEQLDGVGPVTAAKIVAYREQSGGITSVDQLLEVPGIGDARLAAIRTQLGR